MMIFLTAFFLQKIEIAYPARLLCTFDYVKVHPLSFVKGSAKKIEADRPSQTPDLIQLCYTKGTRLKCYVRLRHHGEEFQRRLHFFPVYILPPSLLGSSFFQP